MNKPHLKNIYCLCIIKLSKWLMLIMPVVALFYNENGLDEFDIYLLQAVYSISVAILEIPSGYMADVVGRKKTLVFGSILGTLGFVLYSTSHSFYGFLVAEIILGIGGSFISGADSAMLFDTLASADLKHKYLSFEGRITSLGNVAETLAAILGGAIAGLLSYRSVYIAQALVASIAIPASLMLIEPTRKTSRIGTSLGNNISHILKVCKTSLFTDPKLSSALLFSSVTGIATLCMAWTAQIYFVSHGFKEMTITPLWVLLNLTVAFFSGFAVTTQQLFGPKPLFFCIMIYIPATYILLGIFPIAAALVCLWLFFAIRGYATPVLKDLINQNCDAATRATVLSIRSLIYRVGFATLGPLIGLIAGKFSLAAALVTTGTLLLILSCVTGFYLYRQAPEYF
ncbi:MFS transporter [Desulforhopalus sp. IMCC35007]|uniref:MFS transporter n=1 Tax=Desulforhopalus sp. IMCC35007 TaxID=2569543 RepID=UPI0010AE79BE|nr:MFS transporter [Desulforhopalus sp. IMCC35007]TKB10613.1 MFS transporter [Desulforhopalus sp. IMCC35007]